MDCSLPGLPVHHQLQEFTQTHIHQWCHPTISPSVVSFSSCLQSFPASGSFPVNSFFALGGQSIGVSASASVLPMNIQSGLISFRVDWFDLLVVQGTLKSLLQHHNSKASILKFSWKLTWVLKVGLFPQHFLHSHCGPFTVMLFSPVFTGLGSWVLTIRQLAWGSCP